jgi:hypothetical protein
MALVKPIVNDIMAFDATSVYTVTFSANGGDRVVKNEIKVVYNEYVYGYYKSTNQLFYEDSSFTIPISGKTGVIYIDKNTYSNYIYNSTTHIFNSTSSTEIVAYSHTTTTFNLSHNIPANTLSNGRYYRVAIRTYDELNNYSEWSDYYPFHCYTTPNLYLYVPTVVSSSSFDFNLRYTQIEGEKLDYAIIRLYNNNNVEIKNSGKLYNANTPPLSFDYTVNNLNNNTQYKIKATATTVEGTVVSTNLMTFRVDYETVPSTDSLSAIVDNCDGYINVQSNVIVKMGVESNPDPLTYIDDEKADLLSTASTLDLPSTSSATTWAKWYGLQIPPNFLLRLWFYPARQPFDVIRLTSDNNNTIIQISLKRRSTGDYISIRATGATTRVDLPLNTICNGNTKVFLWLKILDSEWDARATILETENTVLEWNNGSNNNIPYNVTTDLKWGNEDYGSFSPATRVTRDLRNTLTTVIVANGIYDHLNITTDTSLEYSTNIPTEYTYETLLNIDFNGNIGTRDNYTRLLLKRKDDSMSEWMNVYDINSIPSGIPTYINFDDSYIPTQVEQTYALVTYIDNTPSEYYTLKVTPTWGKYFLSDLTNRFTLNYAVIYSNHTQNIQNGVFLPIGAKYPIVIQNGEGNYASGSLQFKILGYQYELNNKLDRISMTKQLKDVLTFLTNGKPKCLTDFNGNIYIFKVINSPQVSYDANWGNNIPVVSFDWVEQAQYNDAEEMLDLGFYERIID